MDVVDEVHELLGRKARRVGGKEGVAFVLRSLPENAKSLFRLLVSEVLVMMDDGGGVGGGGAESTGVEYRIIYNKAVEEFICSSEMAFRTLLKEYFPPFLVFNPSRLSLVAVDICPHTRAESVTDTLTITDFTTTKSSPATRTRWAPSSSASPLDGKSWRPFWRTSCHECHHFLSLSTHRFPFPFSIMLGMK
jgi:hypothetical protein